MGFLCLLSHTDIHIFFLEKYTAFWRKCQRSRWGGAASACTWGGHQAQRGTTNEGHSSTTSQRRGRSQDPFYWFKIWRGGGWRFLGLAQKRTSIAASTQPSKSYCKLSSSFWGQQSRQTNPSTPSQACPLSENLSKAPLSLHLVKGGLPAAWKRKPFLSEENLQQLPPNLPPGFL